MLDLRDHLRLTGQAVNEKRAPPSAADGPRADLSQTPFVRARSRRHAVPVPAAQPVGHGPQRDVEYRHYLSTYGQRLFYLAAVIDWYSRYVLRLAVLQHARRGLLPAGP